MGVHAVGNIGPCMAEYHLTGVVVNLCTVKQGGAGVACIMGLMLLTVHQFHYSLKGTGEPAVVVGLALDVDKIRPF